MLFSELPELSALKVCFGVKNDACYFDVSATAASAFTLSRLFFSRVCFCLYSDTIFTMRLQEMWSSEQQSKFWASLIKIAREIDDVQTAVGRANDSHNKQLSMRVHALCVLCLQLAFISISNFEYIPYP